MLFRSQSYIDVLTEYQKYSLSSSEIIDNSASSMEALFLTEDALIKTALVEAFSIGNGNVTVKFSDRNLNRISEIYNTLRQNPIVSDVQVFTANTQKPNSNYTAATMTITLNTLMNNESNGGN